MGLGPKLMQPTTGCLGKAISEWLELGCMGCGWGGDAGDTTVGPGPGSDHVVYRQLGRAKGQLPWMCRGPSQSKPRGQLWEVKERHCEGADDTGQGVGGLSREVEGW